MWTAALTSTGVIGLWLVARHWYGWLLYLLNEVLWLAYAIHTHDHPLTIMACIWGAVGCRNLWLARRATCTKCGHHQWVRDWCRRCTYRTEWAS